MLEHASVQDAEPDFDLVDPRSVPRGEDEVESPSVALVELLPARAAMDVEVVPDDVDGTSRVLPRKRLHELHEILGTSSSPAMSEDFARAGVEGRDQRSRAVPHVLELQTRIASRSGGAGAGGPLERRPTWPFCAR